MMAILVSISFAFLALQLMNVLLNFVFRQRIGTTQFQNEDLISILIPARNEEGNIGRLLNSLQNIKNDRIEILIYNDQSTDKTADVISHFAKTDNRIRNIDSTNLPEGWLGKNHACFKLAQQAKGNYFLFVDADVELFGNVLSDTVLYARKYKLDLLSIFPYQLKLTTGEKLSVPIMNYILLTLLPLIFVRLSPFKSHAAANGQFMLFNASTYTKFQPHKHFKGSVVEDIEMARFFKQNSLPTACLIGEERVKCRMYKSYDEALLGFSKNIFSFFGNLPIVAFLFWFFAATGLFPVMMFDAHLGLIYLCLMAVIQLLYSLTCKQKPLITLLHFPIHLLFMFQVMLRAMIFKTQKNYQWKGRSIY